jgi:hypothetical protein
MTDKTFVKAFYNHNDGNAYFAYEDYLWAAPILSSEAGLNMKMDMTNVYEPSELTDTEQAYIWAMLVVPKFEEKYPMNYSCVNLERIKEALS